MSADPTTFPLRETAICKHCGLHQFATASLHCRRCQQVLGLHFLKVPLADFPTPPPEDLVRSLPGRVGAIVRKLRLRRGFSQTTLACSAGTSRSYISRIECGHKLPPLLTLLRVIKPLGLNTMTLRFEDTEGPPSSKSVTPEGASSRSCAQPGTSPT
jgi:ribosome-binding protein aMBF1 (putative translation factor)